MTLDALDADYLIELNVSMLSAYPDPKWRYWQGRRDEYIAQNAITDDDAQDMVDAARVRLGLTRDETVKKEVAS